MDRDRRLSLTVGGFVLVGLTALAVAILSLSAEQGLFRPRYRLEAYFDNVQGLVAGAAVRLAGTRVGQVKSVELATRPDGTPAVRVALQIDDAVRERIRADSVAHITTLGLLGDQIVELSIGTSGSPVLEEGDEIATIAPFDLNVMVAKGGSALDQIQALAARLDSTLAEFQSGGGPAKLSDSLDSLGEVIEEVRTGEGALHTLIYEPYEGTAVASLETSLDSLAKIMAEVEHGDGVLHSLIYEEPTEQDLVMQFLQAGSRLNSILAKIDAGEGTLGMLLNDPTLYEELKLLVSGAGRSTVVRSLIDMVAPEDK